MKAIQITEPSVMKVVDIEKPQCGSDEVLLRIHYVGFCGSDLNTYRGLNPMVKMPVIPGHEIGAEIAEVGANVPLHLKAGMAVTVNPYTNCGHCPSCKNRRYNACQHNETLGVQRNGAMCEYIAIPWQKVIPIGNITVEHAALIEPMSVGFHAVSRGQVVDTDTVMVIGCGMVGVGAVVRAIMRGAKVIACDMDDEKLAIVRGLGAEYTINSAKENVHERRMFTNVYRRLLMELVQTSLLRPWVLLLLIKWLSTRWPSPVAWSASAMPSRTSASPPSSSYKKNSISVGHEMPSPRTLRV